MGKTGDILKIFKKITNQVLKYGTVNPADAAAAAKRKILEGAAKSQRSLEAKIDASVQNYANANSTAATAFYTARSTKA